MADFCKQCSLELFGEDFEDLKGLALTLDGHYHAICEGCGVNCVVNSEGECISYTCNKPHGKDKV